MSNTKYRRAADTIDENELSYAEELAVETAEPKLDAEEESYKKRYQDIQRHIQTVRNQKDEELSQVQSQLDAATKKQIKFPKTDAEVEAWATRYPDVAKIVDTIATKRANEVLAQGEARLEQVEKFEQSLNRKSAENQLLELHPDFAEIRASSTNGFPCTPLKCKTASIRITLMLCGPLAQLTCISQTRAKLRVQISQRHRPLDVHLPLPLHPLKNQHSPKAALVKCLIVSMKQTKPPLMLLGQMALSPTIYQVQHDST